MHISVPVNLLTECGKQANKFAEVITVGKIFHTNVPKKIKTFM
jgi:hypothetical protein